MLSDFINENLPTVDYKLKIQSFNPVEPQQEYVEIIAEYATPSRDFIKKSARKLGINDVELYTLAYIIETCHQCTEQQKYEASIVALYKCQQTYNDVVLTNQFKQKIMDSFDYSEASNTSNFDWADQYSDGSQKIFYVLQIVIGKNKLVKLGITNDRLRRRLTTLTSDIKRNYTNALHIEPLLIIACADNELFESEVKILAMEHGCVISDYDFRGSSEVFSSKCKDTVMSIAIDAANKSSDSILFNANDGSGSNQQEDQLVVITSAAIVPVGLSHVSII
ncbi:MAG: hypothetical protein Q8J85_04785 [Sulfuricurvum sp.]|nr:hypothetical protein [Sulfuricurvum sp.]MDP3022721.1 hypothetical protein [Sulfuricurvum sp.]